MGLNERVLQLRVVRGDLEVAVDCDSVRVVPRDWRMLLSRAFYYIGEVFLKDVRMSGFENG